MKKPKIIYVYDAHCSWCYAFSGEMKTLEKKYKSTFDFEVISGGMVVGDQIGKISDFVPSNILDVYARIEKMTGTAFSKEYLEKVKTGEVTVNSEIPAVALSVFKSYDDTKAVAFAHTMQQYLFVKAQSVDDYNLYRGLSSEFGIDAEEFVAKMQEAKYHEAARYDFALSKQLQVSGYPQVFIQIDDTKFYLIAKGYTDFETLNLRVNSVMKEVEGNSLS